MDLEKLEFNKVLDILNKYTNTYIGKDLVNSLNPSTDKNIVKKLLAETTEATILILRKGNAPISQIENISISIKKLESNGFLSSKELLNIAHILKIARELKDYFNSSLGKTDETFPNLESYFSQLYTNKLVEDKIFASIIDENTIDDSASINLKNIRRTIRKIELEIRNKLNSILQSKYIGEKVITIKNGRYVVPVKREYQSSIKGFIHDISSTGATVFIEPMAVFELNNQISNLKSDEIIEIEKVLQNLSSLCFSYTNELALTSSTIGLLDFIFAKAKYGIAIKGIEPILNDDTYINLIKARHPLIDKDKVVPINISLGKDYSNLIITGPNTGGKTVTLKTVGLLSAMGMAGMYIPANEKSSIYVFDNIFADIGDEQSILESLSTFSSHIVNIINIINSVTENSLVLIDEIGSGTDPIEGASLGISILDYFNKIHCLTLTTTHYTEIKNYALTTDSYENASCEFDIEKLQPTYKLLIGVPGKSNAFEISEKLGLNENILNKAKSLIDNTTVSIEDLLKSIYNDKLKIDKEKEKILENSKRIEELKKSLEVDNSTLQEQKREIINKAKVEAKNIILDAKETADNIIKELNDTDSLKNANKLRNDLNNKLKETKIENNIQANVGILKEDVFIGMSVYIPSLNQNGIITSLPNKSNKVKIQIGNTKMNFNIENLVKRNNIKTSQTPADTRRGEHCSSDNHSLVNSFTNKSMSISSEINVIGLNVDEAIPIVDKYLDDCYIANLPTARIVHGKGTGALRKGIHLFLKTAPQVKSYRLGTFGEGEMGVTIVELK